MADPAYSFNDTDKGLQLELVGDWCIHENVPEFPILDAEKHSGNAQWILSAQSIGEWDSMLMPFILKCNRWCNTNNISLRFENMPAAVEKLLNISTAVTPYTSPDREKAGPLSHILNLENFSFGLNQTRAFIEFVGELTKAFVNLGKSKSQTRILDLRYFLEQVGPRAFGIITLISVLVGMILAYLGTVQLRQLGAQIYVADLVGIGMTREMGALMTGIIMAGRTGSAYASQFGAMQVNEEIDALKMMGLSIMEFLVVPRILALVIILPMLCLYSIFLGMFGGAITAIGLDVSWTQYLDETRSAIQLGDFVTGLVKSLFFALLIGIAGCQSGLSCGKDSSSVGKVTTSAVVRAIVYIIIADAAFNILYDKMGV